jgi:preprotein translocase subunit SecY
MQAASALASGISWSVFMIPATIILAAGSMFILWLGERITDKGIGNGISLDHYDWYYCSFASGICTGNQF